MNNPTPPPERAAGSRRPLFLLAMLVLLAPLLGLSAYKLAAEQSDREARENLSAIVLLKVTQLENWLAEREGDAQSLAASRGFIERVRTVQQNGDAHQLALVRDRLTALQQSYGYESISLFDVGGRALLHIGPAGASDHVATFTDIKRPLAGDKDFVLGELHEDAAGRIHLDVSLRLVLPGEGSPEPVGLVVLHINPAKFLFPLVKAWPTASASGEIYIARPDGDQALVMSELRYRPGLAMQLRFPGNSQTFPVAIALRNKDIGTTEGIDYRGMATIAAYRPVPRTDWVVVAKIDRSEALASARVLGIWVALVALVSSLIVATALLILLRQHARAQQLAMQVQADQLLRNFYTLPFIGMAITSPDTKQWIRFNDRLCEILGYTRAQLATKGWNEITHPDDLEKNIALFDGVLRGESEGYQIDKRFVRADGSFVFTTVNALCVRKADGKPDYFVTTVQDVTQRKANESRIVRLGQLYAALGQCNEAIMRSASADELYSAVCHAVVESGGVMFAWIGLKYTDICEVRPVASFGNGAEYLQGIQISLNADVPYGNGPTGTAIRENRPFWCQDFRNDPATAPWHKRAELHGWRASASLPIHQDGAVIGGLTLYADTVNAFDAEAQQLLLRIVANISFALDNMAHDIARRRSEKQLLESEERYRLLFSSSLDAVMLGAPDGRILEANAAACQMLQRSEEEIRRLGRSGLFDASDPRLAAGLQERAGTGRFLGELTVIRGDGSRFPAEVSSAIFTASDGEERSSVILRDISDRKLAEQALAASEQQFRGMIEQSVAGFFIVQDNKLAYANQRLADILGFDSPDELIGRDALFMVPEEDRPPLEELMRQGLAGQSTGVSQVARSRRKDGVMIDIGAHYFVSNYRGQLAIIGLAQDISEKKHSEEEIQRYVKQLEGAFMRTVEVATTISEMRDPYTAGHEKRVAEIAVAIGAEMGFDAKRLEGLRVAGHLHDIGKITIPSEILSKPGKLSETEFLLVKQHPQAGYEVLKNVGFPWPVAEVALLHHERIDGSGYPMGMKGDEIPIEARIMAVADVVESMASHRPYRPGLGIDKALGEIERGRGTSYDAVVADTCLRMFREKGYTIPA